MPSSRRTAIDVPGLAHAGAPFPVAVRLGPLLVTSALHARDPHTGELPDTLHGQAVGVFANVRRVLDASDAGPEHVVKVEVFAEDPAAARAAMAEPWQQLFPDPGDRPVRHTTAAQLPGDFLIQAEITAFIEGNDT